jgi:hypothetical protein
VVNGGTIGSFAIGLVVGMVAGGIASGIGGAASSAIGAGGSGLIASVVRGAIVGGLAGGISSTIMGGSFMQGFVAGAIGGAIGAAAQWEAEANFGPSAKPADSAEANTKNSGASSDDNGRPLTDDEKANYKGQISDQALDAARIHDGNTPWWLRKDMAAVTIHDDIYIRSGEYVPDTAGGVELLGHELTHVVQYEHGLTIFKYMLASIRGYNSNRYEVEAYSSGAQIRANWCTVHVGGQGC